VASHTGAMQAQEHRIQRWAVATRTRNPSQEALMSCFSQRITRMSRHSLILDKYIFALLRNAFESREAFRLKSVESVSSVFENSLESREAFR